MIPKADRDADAAILAAATRGTWITVLPSSQEGGVQFVHAPLHLRCVGDVLRQSIDCMRRRFGVRRVLFHGHLRRRKGDNRGPLCRVGIAAAHSERRRRRPSRGERGAEASQLIDHLSARIETLDEAGSCKSERLYGVMAGLAQARKAVCDFLRGGK